MNVAQLFPGSIVGGDYRVVRALSEGGMGAVYVVDQLSTGKQRALKVMLPQLSGDAKLRDRFVQEARVGGRIESEHVVEVVGAGVDGPLGAPWLAMELLKGETLDALVRRAGALSAVQTREVLVQLLHAMAAAHAAGIVHRDLKPENVFLEVPRREGAAMTVKVLDFGIAKLVSEAAQNTKHTAAIGTPLWMAPEQTEQQGVVTPATDVWAIGLIAFYLLTGRFYWNVASEEGASTMQLLREVCVAPIDVASARAARWGRAIPPGFDAFFARCVVRDPNARFRDARELRAALDSALSDAPTAATDPYVPSAPLASSTVPMDPRVIGSTSVPYAAPIAPMPVAVAPMPRRGSNGAILAIAIAVGAIGAGAFVALRAQKKESPPIAKADRAIEKQQGDKDEEVAAVSASQPSTSAIEPLTAVNEAASSSPPAAPPVMTAVPAVVPTKTVASAPTAKLEAGGSDIQGRLPPEVIRRIVRANFPNFRACYEKGLLKDPSLAGTVSTHFVFASDGHVIVANVVSSSLADSAVNACVVLRFKSLSFPAPEGGNVSVTYPISFTPE